MYIQETTMNSHKVEINISFALWKKGRHIKLFLLGNSAFKPPPPVHTGRTQSKTRRSLKMAPYCLFKSGKTKMQI